MVDMKDGYWHVKLSEESSYLCTFNTPWGSKRFLRMPFGISSASEILQKRNEETFGDIGVHVIADDLIIAPADDKEHDSSLHRVLTRARDSSLQRVLTRARDKGVKFNRDKIQFKISEVEYMGCLRVIRGLETRSQEDRGNQHAQANQRHLTPAPVGHGQVSCPVHSQ